MGPARGPSTRSGGTSSAPTPPAPAPSLVHPLDNSGSGVLIENAGDATITGNAPWHRGGPVDKALADCPHLEFKRLPSYSPQLNVIERFWKPLRRRATHNRLFESLAGLKRSIRASLCYFQTVREKVRGLLAKSYTRPTNQKASAGL